MKTQTLLLALSLVLISATAVQALRPGPAGTNFKCDVILNKCKCDGDREGADCKAMAKNCKDGSWVCSITPGTRPFCSCTMSASARKPQLHRPGAEQKQKVPMTKQQ
jgi:hypothetical protein